MLEGALADGGAGCSAPCGCLCAGIFVHPLALYAWIPA